jgi:ribosome-associated protein
VAITPPDPSVRDHHIPGGGRGQTGPVPGPLQVTSSLVVPEAELSWRFSRSSGPGGQSVNTSDSRAELSYDVARSTALSDLQRTRALDRLASRLVDGVITVAASEQRSQLQNREAAERRLAQLLREAVAPPPRARRPTKPTRGSQERRLQEKKQRGEVKRTRRATDD